MTRRLVVEIVGGTAAEQADALRRAAFTVEQDYIALHHGLWYALLTSGTAEGMENIGLLRISLIEMAEYDHRKLADAWYSGTGAVSRSSNALARATDIEHSRLIAILLGEKQATVKELDAICEELGIAVADVLSGDQ